MVNKKKKKKEKNEKDKIIYKKKQKKKKEKIRRRKGKKKKIIKIIKKISWLKKTKKKQREKERKKNIIKLNKTVKKKKKKEKKKNKIHSFFNFINHKITNFIRKIDYSFKNLKKTKEEEKEEEYPELFNILKEKKEIKEEEKTTYNIHPAIKELLNKEQPQLDENIRLEITKAVLEAQQTPSKIECYNPEEGISLFMNNIFPSIELTGKDEVNEKIVEIKEETVDDNRKEFRERLRGELDRIHNKNNNQNNSINL